MLNWVHAVAGACVYRVNGSYPAFFKLRLKWILNFSLQVAYKYYYALTLIIIFRKLIPCNLWWFHSLAFKKHDYKINYAGELYTNFAKLIFLFFRDLWFFNFFGPEKWEASSQSIEDKTDSSICMNVVDNSTFKFFRMDKKNTPQVSICFNILEYGQREKKKKKSRW